MDDVWGACTLTTSKTKSQKRMSSQSRNTYSPKKKQIPKMVDSNRAAKNVVPIADQNSREKPLKINKLLRKKNVNLKKTSLNEQLQQNPWLTFHEVLIGS